MKRLVIITVGKTHSGKSTFAKKLERKLANSFVMDQDHHAEFINAHYKKLQPKSGPNTLKYSITKLIIDYAKKNTDLHIIVCNSNRSIEGRIYLVNEIYPADEFIRILVHFDFPDEILYDRVTKSQRSTNIFRVATTFEEVLERQQADSNLDPTEEEADHLFVIKDNQEVDKVINDIIKISKG